MKQIGIYLTLPFVLAVPPIIGWAIGSWLDKVLQTRPYMMYLFIILGIVSAFREFCRIIKRFSNDEQ